MIILQPGAYSTIQDLGRVGFRRLGFPVGGAMDSEACRLANALVENSVDEAVIEMTYSGLRFRVTEPCAIALTGVVADILVNQIRFTNDQSIVLQGDDEVQIQTFQKGTRGYLAVRGGFNLPKFLKSYSTAVNLQRGGFQGRPLHSGDELELNPSSLLSRVHHLRPLSDATDQPLRVILGPQAHVFSPATIEQFFHQPFTITPAFDRMGCRLQGAPLYPQMAGEMISDGMTFGAIQVTPQGQCILALADAQTTGGYPKIGVVISADRSRLVQHKPGDQLTFAPVTMKEAQRLYRVHNQELETRVD